MRCANDCHVEIMVAGLTEIPIDISMAQLYCMGCPTVKCCSIRDNEAMCPAQIGESREPIT